MLLGLRRGSQSPPQARFAKPHTQKVDTHLDRHLDTYGGEEFGVLVEAVLGLSDESCEDLNPAQQARATEAFTTGRYERMFWDAAWRPEERPVGWGGFEPAPTLPPSPPTPRYPRPSRTCP